MNVVLLDWIDFRIKARRELKNTFNKLYLQFKVMGIFTFNILLI